MSKDIESKLKDHRGRIDDIDANILALLNQRIETAQQIGKIKSSFDKPIFYHPEREARVLQQLRTLNPGPIDNAAMEALFREIMSIARSSEVGLSVAILGPLGTYSETAARQHFGSSIKMVPYTTIDEIFRATETGQTDFAVVPTENSTEGGVNDTLNRLMTTSLLACGEVNMRIQHHLLSTGEQLSKIRRVYAHSQALAQCKRWLDRNLPNVALVATSSNADAAVQVSNDPSAAAIAGDNAAKRYELKYLSEHIEDEVDNTTRFLVFSNLEVPSSGNDKTSLLLSCKNEPGALLQLLKPLLDHDINMVKIESRPSKAGLWKYVFFIDIAGHQLDSGIDEALRKIEAEASMYKNLGSYPIAG